MRIRCYKITFLKNGSLESLEVIIPSYNQEFAKRNMGEFKQTAEK